MPSGNCMQYRYCFEVQSNNNIPDSTKIVFAFIKAENWQQGGVCRQVEGCYFDCGAGRRLPATSSGMDYLEIDDPAYPLNNPTTPDTSIITPPLPPLPLALLSFEARADKNAVFLRWELAQEAAGDVYILQRSADALGWEDLEEQAATGVLRYAYEDKNPLWGANYYRIKMRDAQQQIDYSPLRMAQIGEEAPTAIRIFPNPAKDFISVLLPQAQGLRIDIFDARGGLILSEEGQGGLQLHRFDVSALGSGLYLLRLSDSATGQVLACERLRK